MQNLARWVYRVRNTKTDKEFVIEAVWLHDRDSAEPRVLYIPTKSDRASQHAMWGLR